MTHYKESKKHSNKLQKAIFNNLVNKVIFFIQYYATHSTFLRIFVHEKVAHLK